MTVLHRSRLVLAAVALCAVAGLAQAGGLDLRTDADSKDVGMPIYPGAVKTADPDGDASGFSFGLWGDSFGFKLAVASFRSADSVDAVAAFYREAMGRYGPVLDCTGVHRKPGHHDDDESARRNRPVTCEDDSVAAGGRLYKVGLNRAQRVFKVSPAASGSTFQLVRIEMRGGD